MYGVEKTCSNCKITKSVDEFYKNGQQHSVWCKDCCREHSKKQAEQGYFKTRWENNLIAKGSNQTRFKPKDDTDKIIWNLAADHMNNIQRRTKLKGYVKECSVDKTFLYNKITEFCKNSYHTLEPRSPFRPSVDRIDNNIGYTEENTKIVWLIENLCKSTFTEEDVVEFCKRKLGLL